MISNEKLWAGVANMFLQLLITLHSSNHSHGDIKSYNLMFTEGTKEGKMINFGYTDRNELGEKLDDKRGTLRYAAPEIVLSDKSALASHQGSETDLFAFGILLFYMVTKDYPWEQASDQKQKSESEGPGYSDIFQFDLFDTFWEHQEKRLKREFTNEFKLIFQGLVTKDPSARLSHAELHGSAWLQKGYSP